MNCVHCNAPGAHPGTQKCTDLHACHGRQEYARGVADERARVVADLRAWCGEFGVTVQEQAVFMAAADRYERGEHEREGA